MSSIEDQSSIEDEGTLDTRLEKHPKLLTYETINNIHTQIKSNTTSVLFNLGGRTHGLLGLLPDSVTYQTLTGIMFTKPLIPSPDQTIPDISSDPVISQFE